MHLRSFIILIFLLLTATAFGVEDSTFVYDIFEGEPTCAIIEQRLAALPLRKTVLLSVEQGAELVLDRPTGSEQLHCALTALRRGSHDVKPMLLQDISFLKNETEAMRRVLSVMQFSRRSSVRAIVIDIEPYVDEFWDCGSLADKRNTGAQYISLLRKLRDAALPLKLEAVVPWWYSVERSIPELMPASLFTVADGIYAMFYGDPGGPLVNGAADLVLKRLPKTSPFFGKGRIYIALATYEARSLQHLNHEIEIVRKHYADAPGFSGISVFRAGGPYAAPLLRSISGSVNDAQGTGLASALVRFAESKSQTNSCGHFGLRGNLPPEGDLIVSKAGFQTLSQRVLLPPPGRVRELGPIRLLPIR
jgi:hypothetical protein